MKLITLASVFLALVAAEAAKGGKKAFRHGAKVGDECDEAFVGLCFSEERTKQEFGPKTKAGAYQPAPGVYTFAKETKGEFEALGDAHPILRADSTQRISHGGSHTKSTKVKGFHALGQWGVLFMATAEMEGAVLKTSDAADATTRAKAQIVDLLGDSDFGYGDLSKYENGVPGMPGQGRCAHSPGKPCCSPSKECVETYMLKNALKAAATAAEAAAAEVVLVCCKVTWDGKEPLGRSNLFRNAGDESEKLNTVTTFPVGESYKMVPGNWCAEGQKKVQMVTRLLGTLNRKQEADEGKCTE